MSIAEDFAAFWANYPRKTAKLDAVKAYTKARSLASATDILDGLERYKQHKPDYADWCHPATFLNKGRWMDEYEVAAPVVKEYWADECQRVHGGTCSKQWAHATRMLDEQQRLDSREAALLAAARKPARL
jgi:hypothetical protein